MVPQTALLTALASILRDHGVTSLASIGSGSGLLEWLLAGSLPRGTPILCVDPLYHRDGRARCVAPVARGVAPSQDGAKLGGSLRWLAPPSLETGAAGVLEGIGMRPIGLGWGCVEASTRPRTVTNQLPS